MGSKLNRLKTGRSLEPIPETRKRGRRHSRNDDAVLVFEFSRSARDCVRFSIDSISRSRVRFGLQTRVDAQIREAGFSGRGSTATAAAGTNSHRSFLRFSGEARRENSGGIKKS